MAKVQRKKVKRRPNKATALALYEAPNGHANRKGKAPKMDDIPERDYTQADWNNLREDYKRNREAFVHQYVLDFNASAAMCRLGYELGRPAVKGYEWLHQPYTQWYLAQIMEKIEVQTLVTKTQIMFGLKKEAHHHGLDGNSAARIQAWRALSKILGLEITKTENVNNNINAIKGGVMVIPLSGSPEDWERSAMVAQEELKKAVRT